MKNQREIYEALLAGETLVKKNTFKVKLSDAGMLANESDNIYARSLVNTIFAEPQKWQIYKEPKWYENIPDGGALCRDKGGDIVEIVGSSENYLTNKKEGHYTPDYIKPLTKQEIQVFMDNAP